MELYGTLEENLRAAVASAKRHEGHPVRTETVQFWSDLLQHCRSEKLSGRVDDDAAEPLMAQLDAAVASRRSSASSA